MENHIIKNIDKENITNQFIEKFIFKTRKERSYYELNNEKKRFNFIDRFNHCWEDMLDMRFITQIPSDRNAYRYITKDISLFTDIENCYIISEFNDIDDTFMCFEDAFMKIYGRGLASLLSVKIQKDYTLRQSLYAKIHLDLLDLDYDLIKLWKS